jgi:uncharacterized protein YcbK (DUF882 family)
MSRVQLTPHFWLHEFDCKDGTPVPDEYVLHVYRLAEQLEVLREALGGSPMRITSGYRSPSHNKKVKGGKRSQHLLAKAADITVAGVDAPFVYATAKRLIREGKMMKGGLGRYSSFTHYDIRGRNARWRGK